MVGNRERSQFRQLPDVLRAWAAVPIIFAIGLLASVLKFKLTVDLTPRDVERYFENFLDGCDGYWEWDDFTSSCITDPMLDDIRKKATSVNLPLDAQGRATLQQLLEQVRAM